MFSLDFGGEVLLVYVVVLGSRGRICSRCRGPVFVAAVVGVLEVWRDCGFVRLTESMAAKMALTAELLWGRRPCR